MCRISYPKGRGSAPTIQDRVWVIASFTHIQCVQSEHPVAYSMRGAFSLSRASSLYHSSTSPTVR